MRGNLRAGLWLDGASPRLRWRRSISSGIGTRRAAASSVFEEEFLDRGGGPDFGDYAGLPINDALRFKRRCIPFTGDDAGAPVSSASSTYQYRSPGGLSILKEYDPVTQQLSAIALRHLRPCRAVWMDGRPLRRRTAHTYEGVSTGRWEGNRLLDRDAHSKAGFIRRNGIAHSDRARMIEYLVWHDDYLSIIDGCRRSRHLDEPFVRSTDFQSCAATPARRVRWFRQWRRR